MISAPSAKQWKHFFIETAIVCLLREKKVLWLIDRDITTTTTSARVEKTKRRKQTGGAEEATTSLMGRWRLIKSSIQVDTDVTKRGQQMLPGAVQYCIQ
jgi:hypothetical protein